MTRMTDEQDPPRLLQTRDAELSELLPGLRRAQREGPSHDQLARICAGVASRAGADSGAMTEPEPASTTSAPGPSGTTITGTGRGTGIHTTAPGSVPGKLLKLLLAGALIGGAIFYGMRAQNRVPADRATRTAPASTPRPPAAADAPPRAPTPITAPLPSTTPTPTPIPAPPGADVRDDARHSEPTPLRGEVRPGTTRGGANAAARRAAPRAEATEAAQADIDAELALLKRARAEVRPNPDRALALTREHAARFTRGTFSEEREVIAIEALLVAGREDAAEARARAFFSAHPGSAHGRRVRALLAEHAAELRDEKSSEPSHPSQ